MLGELCEMWHNDEWCSGQCSSFWSTARNSTNLLQTTKPGSTCYTLRSYSSLFYAFFSCFHSYRQLCSSWYLMVASNFNLYIISVVFIFSISCSILAIKLSIAIDFLLDLSLILCGTSTFTSFWSTRIHFLIVFWSWTLYCSKSYITVNYGSLLPFSASKYIFN